jgi:putative ABC transport system permease protein
VSDRPFALLPLLGSAFRRHRLRLFFTLASIVVAFMLFGLLAAVRFALTAGVEIAGQDRIITTHKTSIIEPLPRSYLTQIRELGDVRRASSLSWFGGIYRDPRVQLVVFAIDPNYFDLYAQYHLPAAALAEWQADRAAAIVGETLAARYGWKVGETVPLKSNVYRRKDGGGAWPIRIVGIYTSDNEPPNNIFIHYDYLNETVAANRRDQIGWVVSQLKNPAMAPAVSAEIDALFANSRQETKTSTEKAVAQSFANQIGDIGAILTFVVSAVFFAMLLVTANTMAQSVRERTPELAVLKTLGFTNLSVLMLVLLESLLVTGVGGTVGLGLAYAMTAALEPALHAFLPFFTIPASALLTGLLCIVALGFAAGMIPAWQAMRLQIVRALRTT